MSIANYQKSQTKFSAIFSRKSGKMMKGRKNNLIVGNSKHLDAPSTTASSLVKYFPDLP
jgi:hypothetical protein